MGLVDGKKRKSPVYRGFQEGFVYRAGRSNVTLAEWTGLEPATPGVTGRYSNQLNYHSW